MKYYQIQVNKKNLNQIIHMLEINSDLVNYSLLNKS